MNDSIRKLASIRKIDAIDPIPGADAIECATIGGWKVVVEKGVFSPGDLAIYFEIDSWIPNAIAPFLSKGNEPRLYNGVRGERLRTIRLRKVLSQGLLLPLDRFHDRSTGDTGYIITDITSLDDEGYIENFIKIREGDDVTEFLGIQKWEPTIPAQLRGVIRGNFPSFIRKTDQERAQNLVQEIEQHKNEEFEVTIKLDGTSFTAYHNNGDTGCCSRNLLLKHDEGINKDNAHVRMFYDGGFNFILPQFGRNIAIQGELMGPGIQGNRENFKQATLYVFDIFDIDNQRYFNANERAYIFHQLIEQGLNSGIVNHAPVLPDIRLNEIGNIQDILNYAEGSSINHSVREGIVFKSLETDFTFKAISNQFLLNEK
jgi:RNA ligase (TIGR02306 family)